MSKILNKCKAFTEYEDFNMNNMFRNKAIFIFIFSVMFFFPTFQQKRLL